MFAAALNNKSVSNTKLTLSGLKTRPSRDGAGDFDEFAGIDKLFATFYTVGDTSVIDMYGGGAKDILLFLASEDHRAHNAWTGSVLFQR